MPSRSTPPLGTYLAMLRTQPTTTTTTTTTNNNNNHNSNHNISCMAASLIVSLFGQPVCLHRLMAFATENVQLVGHINSNLLVEEIHIFNEHLCLRKLFEKFSRHVFVGCISIDLETA